MFLLAGLLFSNFQVAEKSLAVATAQTQAAQKAITAQVAEVTVAQAAQAIATVQTQAAQKVATAQVAGVTATQAAQAVATTQVQATQSARVAATSQVQATQSARVAATAQFQVVQQAQLVDLVYQDCIPYAAANLKVIEGTNGWMLTDGINILHTLASQSDANQAKALAQQYTAQCFIGRNNQRPNRLDYILEFWSGDSKPKTPLRSEDCLRYDPTSLRADNLGTTGWLLTDGVSRIHLLDDQPDASLALTLARRYSYHCFIGRRTPGTASSAPIVEYWK